MSKRFIILSLSGGGCRGIFQAKYLEKIKEKIDKPLYKVFDLITGTSTGAIVGLMLAFGREPKEIVDLFSTHAKEIFPSRSRLQRLRATLSGGPLYNQSSLRMALVEKFGDRKLPESKTKVLVTASHLHQYSHKLFFSGQPNDREYSVVDVALSSAAAPFYFDSVKPTNSETKYIDGGLWANSPSLAAVLFAKDSLKKNFEDIKLLSIGTGKPPNEVTCSINGIGPLINFLFSIQETSIEAHTKVLLNENNYMNINPQLATRISLDDTDTSCNTLAGLANTHANEKLNDIVEFIKR